MSLDDILNIQRGVKPWVMAGEGVLQVEVSRDLLQGGCETAVDCCGLGNKIRTREVWK